MKNVCNFELIKINKIQKKKNICRVDGISIYRQALLLFSERFLSDPHTILKESISPKGNSIVFAIVSLTKTKFGAEHTFYPPFSSLSNQFSNC